MKKLLVLMLVLGMGSIASAGFMHEIVEWSVEGGQLIGTGTANGTYDAFLATGLIAPAATTDGAVAGVNARAGNAGKVDDYGVVYNAHAEHIAIGGGSQAPGVWFVFDILDVGNVELYNADQSVAGQIAVPEPMSLALLGLGGLFLRRRK